MDGCRTFGESEKEILKTIDKLNKDNVNIIARTILNNVSHFKGEFATTAEDGTTNFSSRDNKNSFFITKEKAKYLYEFILLMEYLTKEKISFSNY